MRASIKILLFSLLTGISVWLLFAFIDAYFFSAGTFSEMLYTKLNAMQITHRLIIVLISFILGSVVANSLSKLQNSNRQLEHQKLMLDKRIKEINCLYKISGIIEQPNITIEKTLDEIVHVIPAALQYPEISNASITFNSSIFRVENIPESPIKITYPLKAFNKEVGIIEVSYNSTDRSKLSFLNDESILIKAISERVGKTIERQISRDELRKSQDILRGLTAYLHTSRENERMAIAREIHDELGQVLTALKINLSLLDKYLTHENEPSKDYLCNELKDMQDMIDVTIKKIRKLITELRPETLDNLGLVEALQSLSIDFAKQSGIKCNFSTNTNELKLNKDFEIAIYRIYQESLTNARRHSKATSINSQLAIYDEILTLSITDDGIGFDSENYSDTKSFGILGMKERAYLCGGDLQIISKPGSATTVLVNIPLKGNSISPIINFGSAEQIFSHSEQIN